jgi:anti-anti-sigma factor
VYGRGPCWDRGRCRARRAEEKRDGRIIVDLADLDYLDSSGLGALVGLKVSAIHQGKCRLELDNLSARIRELLSMTNLMQVFAK